MSVRCCLLWVIPLSCRCQGLPHLPDLGSPGQPLLCGFCFCLLTIPFLSTPQAWCLHSEALLVWVMLPSSVGLQDIHISLDRSDLRGTDKAIQNQSPEAFYSVQLHKPVLRLCYEDNSAGTRKYTSIETHCNIIYSDKSIKPRCAAFGLVLTAAKIGYVKDSIGRLGCSIG